MGILTAMVTFAIAALLAYCFSSPASRFYLLDHPNNRSLHTRATPRTGGVAVFIAILLGSIVFMFFSQEYPPHVIWLGVAVLLVGSVSFIDDIAGLSPIYRLTTHLVATALLLYAEFEPGPIELPGFVWEVSSMASMFISLLFILWMVNLYNFMDGMDGFAGGMAVIGFSTFALFGAWQNMSYFQR